MDDDEDLMVWMAIMMMPTRMMTKLKMTMVMMTMVMMTMVMMTMVKKMMMIHMMLMASFNRETFTVGQLYGNAANKCEHAPSHWNTSARRRKKYFVTLKYFIRIFLLHILCEHACMPIYISKTGKNAI